MIAHGDQLGAATDRSSPNGTNSTTFARNSNTIAAGSRGTPHIATRSAAQPTTPVTRPASRAGRNTMSASAIR